MAWPDWPWPFRYFRQIYTIANEGGENGSQIVKNISCKTTVIMNKTKFLRPRPLLTRPRPK